MKRKILIVCAILIVVSLGIIKYRSTIKAENYIINKKYEAQVSIEGTDKIKDYTIEDMKEFNEGQIPSIQYDDGKRIKSIIGTYTDKKVLNEEDAIYSLYNIKSLLSIKEPAEEFISENTIKIEGQVIYRLQQIYKGLLVYSNELIIVTDESGKVQSISGNYTPIGNIDLSNVISEKKAIKLAKKQCKKLNTKYSGEIVIYAYEIDNPTVAWKINAKNSSYINDNKVIFIDAYSGDKINEIGNII